MTAVAFLFGAMSVFIAVLLAIAVFKLDRSKQAVTERDREIGRLETALGNARQAHESTRTELLGAKVTERYFRVAYDHQSAKHLHMELAGRILPDLRDDLDLSVPSWPMVSAPIFDSTPDALEVESLVLAHIAEQVA